MPANFARLRSSVFSRRTAVVATVCATFIAFVASFGFGIGGPGVAAAPLSSAAQKRQRQQTENSTINPPNSGSVDGVLVQAKQTPIPAGDPWQAQIVSKHQVPNPVAQIVDSTGVVTATAAFGKKRRWNGSQANVVPLLVPGLPSGDYSIRLSWARNISYTPIEVRSARVVANDSTAAILGFFGDQQDGNVHRSAPLPRQPSHLNDRRARMYAEPRYHGDQLIGTLRRLPGRTDSSGGWLDAGDNLKFVETASFTDLLLAWTAVHDGGRLSAPTQRQLLQQVDVGARWLLADWHSKQNRLVYQVGIGTGNRKIIGDHDVPWRLSERDDARPNGSHGRNETFERYRPALVTGPKLSPNLAGRTAAALALAAQAQNRQQPKLAQRELVAAKQILRHANTHPKHLLTTSPFSYYPETSWSDDMTLGYVEVANALRMLKQPGAQEVLKNAAKWESATIHGPFVGWDTLNLYEVSGLADFEYARAAATFGDHAQRSLVRPAVSDLRAQIKQGEKVAAVAPYGTGHRFAAGDTTQHLFGLSLSAELLDGLLGSTKERGFAEQQRAVALGENPWGMSWIVGFGRSWPLCLHSQLANLSGSLSGQRPGILTGAVVSGADARSGIGPLKTPDGANSCSANQATLQSADNRHSAYVDAVASSLTNEPADDAAAIALAALATER